MESNEEDTQQIGINTLQQPPSLRLQLFSNHETASHGPPWPGTPPHHTAASVPFQWEAQPGKPKPCTTLATLQTTTTKSLELPPRLVESKITKTPSPTTVLEGPYIGRSILESSSFRFLRKRENRQYGSFDGVISLGDESSPRLGGLLLGFTSSTGRSCRRESKGLFGNWRKRGSGSNMSEIGEGSFVFSSFDDEGIGRMRRKRSLLSFSSTKHFWASIYGTVKQIIPRKPTKLKKDDF